MIERPRGTRDFGPEEMARRRSLESAFSAVARRFGYQEVATPTFEHADLFIAKSGPAIVKDMYVFKDKAGRRLALRPELTAPVVRFYLSELRNRPKPIKVYYLGSCYRYEEPQFGRYREFFQFGVEILGANPLDSDAEVVATAVEAVREAGLKGFQVRIGHIGLIRSLLPVDSAKQTAIIGFLDKRDEKGLQGELDASGKGEMTEALLKLVNLRGGRDTLKEAVGIVDELGGGKAARSALEYLGQLGDRLGLYDIRDLLFDLGIVRGLDYYTGLVFELHYEPLGAASQICGGGSYSLTDIFGDEPLPTTGFGMGFDRVLLALEKAEVHLPSVALDTFIVPVGDHMREAAYEVLAVLRRKGYSADIDLVGRGLSKNLDYANALGARFAVLVGEKEWEEGKVALRDMNSGEQREIPTGNLAAHLARLVESLGAEPQ